MFFTVCGIEESIENGFICQTMCYSDRNKCPLKQSLKEQVLILFVIVVCKKKMSMLHADQVSTCLQTYMNNTDSYCVL